MNRQRSERSRWMGRPVWMLVGLVVLFSGSCGDAPELIPAGFFQMGDAFNEGDSDERPVHTVTVSGFYMDKYEVTNAQYRAYDASHDSRWHEQHSLDDGHQPVVLVSWWDAIKYCNWRSRQERLEACYDKSTGECDFNRNGYRLPTEAEWEYAARGGQEGKRYVWGDGSPPSGAANVADETAKRQWPNWIIFDGYDDGYEVSALVGRFSPNAYGLYNMAGNVSEWCNDWYDGGYYSKSPENNPSGSATSSYRVLRGGSWFLNPFHFRCASRSLYNPEYSSNFVGFRCVRRP